jgi:hypothetical protein
LFNHHQILYGASKVTDRRRFSNSTLEKLRNLLSRENSLPAFAKSNLSIFVTGSFGREEAGENSDLDAFFFAKGSNAIKSDRIKPVNAALTFAHVIRSTQEVGLPNFTKEGEYLEFHYIDDVVNNLGSREEDFHNSFTARMLMILEAKPLYNDDLFCEFRSRIINSYFRDFGGHETNFVPTFLINDILRFWRTLCLNYEHARWAGLGQEQNAKHTLKNLKLKFSRLNTCFSFILTVLAEDNVTPEIITDICTMTPKQRLDRVGEKGKAKPEMINLLQNSYSWFLSQTYPQKNEVISWLSDDSARVEALTKAKEFGDHMFDLIRPLAEEKQIFRYLVI